MQTRRHRYSLSLAVVVSNFTIRYKMLILELNALFFCCQLAIESFFSRQIFCLNFKNRYNQKKGSYNA